VEQWRNKTEYSISLFFIIHIFKREVNLLAVSPIMARSIYFPHHLFPSPKVQPLLQNLPQRHIQTRTPNGDRQITITPTSVEPTNLSDDPQCLAIDVFSAFFDRFSASAPLSTPSGFPRVCPVSEAVTRTTSWCLGLCFFRLSAQHQSAIPRS
jgi:hypothetical protein